MASTSHAEEEIEEQYLHPNLQLAQMKYLLTLPDHKDDTATKDHLMEAVIDNSMTPFYESLCTDLNWRHDSALHKKMKNQNKEDLKVLNDAIEFAEANLSLTELKEAILNKAVFFCKIADKENAIKTYSLAYDKTIALGSRIDNILQCIRIGLFFKDHDLMVRYLQRCDELLKEATDWERKNQLNVYKGLFYLTIRDFRSTCNIYLTLTGTFSSYNIMSGVEFIRYTVYAAILILPRTELKQKIIDNPAVLEMITTATDIKDYVFSLYNCHYAEFFRNLAQVEQNFKRDFYLHEHYRFYVREMKIKAYTQLLFSYRSMSIKYMAQEFGVTDEYIESDLYKFIVAGRIRCKIDRISRCVINEDGDRRSENYESVLKQGDVLLNRIEKLTKILET